MKTLETLDLYDHRLSDLGLKKLSELTNLRELNLSLGLVEHRKNYTHPISHRGLAHLTHLKELQSLAMSNTDVTDVGLQQVAMLTQLRHPHLSGTKVTASGQAAFITLEHLESLDITATPVLQEPHIDLRSLKSLKSVTADEYDQTKILLRNGCAVTTFD